MDIHAGLPKFLRNKGLNEIAARFDELDQLRHGRWYGNQINGDTMKEAEKIINKLEMVLEDVEKE